MIVNLLSSSTPTNGVFYVGKEERAPKIKPEGQEVVISVVENPRKQSAEASENVDLVGKKRPKSLLSNIATTEKSEPALLMNGPFVASEMLRNVAKRQRRNSEDSSVINGSAEQKGPMAWDKLVRTQSKPPAKLPIAVNGVRLNILTEHEKDYGAKNEENTNSEKHVQIKTTNHPVGNILNTTPDNMTNSTANKTGLKCPAVTATNIVPGTLPTVVSQGHSSSGNDITRSVVTTTTVGVTTPKDQTPSDNPRGEQVSGVVQPYQCLWSGCKW